MIYLMLSAKIIKNTVIIINLTKKKKKKKAFRLHHIQIIYNYVRQNLQLIFLAQ